MASDSLILCLLVAAEIVAQSGVSDWTHMASMPFAVASASFLIFSLVGLLRIIFDSWKQTNKDTIDTLREQVASLRRFQDDTLVGMIAKVTKAMDKDAEASTQIGNAWSEVHEDFRDLIAALRRVQCLHDSDFPDSPPAANERTIAAIERRKRRNEEREGDKG